MSRWPAPGAEKPAAYADLRGLPPRVVDQIVGGRLVTRMPSPPDAASFELPPDWGAEILSPSTARFDRADMLLHARWRVAHAWRADPDLRTLEACASAGGRRVLPATPKDDEPVRQLPFDAEGFALPALRSP